MQHTDFRAAREYASHFTLAVQQGRAVGYQLSTTYADGGVHLARLATLPEYRGQRIGTQLVAELIQHFPKRRITVNTQATNLSSLHLYQRLQFEHRAVTTPFWIRYI
jgi:ribosomal protein S18 acetylase RimI-like enzyme